MGNLVFFSVNVLKELYKVLLFLDGCVYWVVDTAYQTFVVVSRVRLFSTATFTDFASRIYAVIGIVMLFIIAFQLLTNIVDPDKMKSGDNSAEAIVKNVITTVIIIVILPTAFKYLYKIQEVVLTEDIIGNIIFDNSNDSGNYTVSKAGKTIVVNIYSAFINVYGESTDPYTSCQGKGYAFCDAYLNHFANSEDVDYGNVFVFTSKQKTADGNKEYGKEIANEIDAGSIEYKMIITLIAGGIAAALIVSFCIDMGVRVAKLSFFQLIAPIPAAFRILPKQKSIFDNWLKKLMSIYFEVFIRIAIVYFAVFLISKVSDVWNTAFASQTDVSSGLVNLLGKVIVILGILLFAKQAPKLIGDIFGIDSGGMKLGIKDKIKDAALIGSGTMIGKAANKLEGGVTGAAGRGYSALVNKQNVANALTRGFVNGYQTGGPQARAQMDDLYHEATGDLTGKAGAFGGADLAGRMKESAKADEKYSYKQVYTKRANKAEAKEQYQSGVKKYIDSYVAQNLNSKVKEGMDRAIASSPELKKAYAEYNGLKTETERASYLSKNEELQTVMTQVQTQVKTDLKVEAEGNVSYENISKDGNILKGLVAPEKQVRTKTERILQDAGLSKKEIKKIKTSAKIRNLQDKSTDGFEKAKARSEFGKVLEAFKKGEAPKASGSEKPSGGGTSEKK